MRTFAHPHEALEVYTDGSHAGKQGLYAYGWVVANPTLNLEVCRVVAYQEPKMVAAGATLMESAAIVDALKEFSNRNRKVVIYADNQALAHYVALLKAGKIAFHEFASKNTVIRQADAFALGKLMDVMDFEIRWVKGHRSSFYNLVCDQMLRMASLDGEGERAASEFAKTALAARRAQVWCKQSRIEDGETVYFNAYKEVFLETV